MRPFLFDTAVFLYAVGSEHPYREPCREILKLVEEGVLAGDASVELIQEFAHVRLRRTRDLARTVRQAHSVGRVCRVHDFRHRDLVLALEVWSRYAMDDLRDAVFVATALNRGIDVILSPDRDFDVVEEIERIDPADPAAVATLTSQR